MHVLGQTRKEAGVALANCRTMVKWLLLGMLVGLVVGAAGSLFAHVLSWVNGFRSGHSWVILLLPLGGLLIVALYRGAKNTADKGTNTVLSAVMGDVELSWKTAPLIFVSTAITHLCGGSAGREGAALQLGGSLATVLAKPFRLQAEDRRIMVMCGMSAGFSALFGTPLAAAVFSLEVAWVGVMQYAALLPCATAAIMANLIAKFFQVPPEVFLLAELPAMTVGGFGKVVVLAAAAAGISVCFCHLMHSAEHLYQKYLKNPYLRITVAGCLVVLLTAALQSDDYLGSGMGIIEHIFHEGETRPLAFLLKMLFTAVTLSAGFKGGEIVPSFTIGAAFGCAVASLLGLPAELAAACGMAALFCGVTNAPVTSILISFELFGFAGMPYYLTAVAVAFFLSGSCSLYHTQRQLPDKKLRLY